MNWLKTIVAASSVAIIGSTASASTVINGSFEDIGNAVLTGTGGGSWTFFNGVTGWTGDPNIEIQSNGTIGAVDAQEGSYYAELDTNQDARMFQDIALDAGTYLLSFFYSPRVNASPTTTNDMTYVVATDAGMPTGVDLVNELITGAPNYAYAYGEWTQVKSYFTLASSQTIQLSFAATGGSHASGCGNCGALIDNVTLAAVPLPAGVLLMLSALGAFGFARRRTQA